MPSSWMFAVAGWAVLASNEMVAQDVSVIHVYGPGGPAPAMLECAHTFNARSGANVTVTFGPTSRWREAASRDADMWARANRKQGRFMSSSVRPMA